ncbi:unnamed protein product [Peniophora sp. CBMAI 1063]|nr:unnamed protein product [Peniophora sp. CBMAI 1063]
MMISGCMNEIFEDFRPQAQNGELCFSLGSYGTGRRHFATALSTPVALHDPSIFSSRNGHQTRAQLKAHGHAGLDVNWPSGCPTLLRAVGSVHHSIEFVALSSESKALIARAYSDRLGLPDFCAACGTLEDARNEVNNSGLPAYNHTLYQAYTQP